MKHIESLTPFIMPRVPGAAEPVVFDAIRRAAQEFCETTRLWRYDDSFEASGEPDEIMAAPVGSYIFEIESARFDGRPLEPIALTDLERLIQDWRSLDNAAPKYITQAEPDTVMLVPKGAGKVDLTLTLKPSDDTELLPTWLIDKYSRAIADGAIAELMMMPGQPYSNPQLAGVHAQRFQARLATLFGANIKGQQKAPARTIAQFF